MPRGQKWLPGFLFFFHFPSPSLLACPTLILQRRILTILSSNFFGCYFQWYCWLKSHSLIARNQRSHFECHFFSRDLAEPSLNQDAQLYIFITLFFSLMTLISICNVIFMIKDCLLPRCLCEVREYMWTSDLAQCLLHRRDTINTRSLEK